MSLRVFIATIILLLFSGKNPNCLNIVVHCFYNTETFAGLSNYGNQFFIGVLRSKSSETSSKIVILAPTPAQFNISSLTGYNYTGSIPAYTPVFIDIESNFQVLNSSYNYRHLGLRITSPQFISVAVVEYANNTPRSSYLALPCHDQPTEKYIYYGISHESDERERYGVILLVGCRDNTTVTITPTETIQLPSDPQQSNSTVDTITAGTSHTVILHEMQTLIITIKSTIFFSDLSGTKIVSNYPLTVIGGHECAKVTVWYQDCDPIATQVPPTINWGTEFFTMPFYNRTKGYLMKIMASENNTNVSLKCSNVVSSYNLILAGNVISHHVQSSHYCYIQCSQPCYIAELAFGGQYANGGGYGDPLLITIPPIRQYPQNVTFTILPDMPTIFYSVAVPVDSYFNGTLIINGVLTSLNWTTIYSTNNNITTGYGYKTTANGTYTISHSHPYGKICIIVYGFYQHGGYGYLSGMLLDPIFPISPQLSQTSIVSSQVTTSTSCNPYCLLNTTTYYIHSHSILTSSPVTVKSTGEIDNATSMSVALTSTGEIGNITSISKSVTLTYTVEIGNVTSTSESVTLTYTGEIGNVTSTSESVTLTYTGEIGNVISTSKSVTLTSTGEITNVTFMSMSAIVTIISTSKSVMLASTNDPTTNEPSRIPSITVPVDNSNIIIICLVAVVLILVCIIIGSFLFYLHGRKKRLKNVVVDTSLSIGNPVAVHIDIIDGHSDESQPTNEVNGECHHEVIDPDGFILSADVSRENRSQSIPQPSPVNPTHLMLELQEKSEPDGPTQSSTVSCESTQTLH